ncbi:hypothetical protein Nepgr_019602 [Nepenthes gracilis]|uniref:Uncharacterized protein n=1 Tax=Nepenthes gracilis TaxID=150966 RepID=A0AAD3XVH9_NEPGR|nr:hypothetical protein Nepgr_019602 [Nepenthes gracilis]
MASMGAVEGRVHLLETTHCDGGFAADISHVIKTASMAVLGRCLLMLWGFGSLAICAKGVIMAVHRMPLDHLILMEQLQINPGAYLHSRLGL